MVPHRVFPLKTTIVVLSLVASVTLSVNVIDTDEAFKKAIESKSFCQSIQDCDNGYNCTARREENAVDARHVCLPLQACDKDGIVCAGNGNCTMIESTNAHVCQCDQDFLGLKCDVKYTAPPGAKSTEPEQQEDYNGIVEEQQEDDNTGETDTVNGALDVEIEVDGTNDDPNDNGGSNGDNGSGNIGGDPNDNGGPNGDNNGADNSNNNEGANNSGEDGADTSGGDGAGNSGGDGADNSGGDGADNSGGDGAGNGGETGGAHNSGGNDGNSNSSNNGSATVTETGTGAGTEATGGDGTRSSKDGSGVKSAAINPSGRRKSPTDSTDPEVDSQASNNTPTPDQVVSPKPTSRLDAMVPILIMLGTVALAVLVVFGIATAKKRQNEAFDTSPNDNEHVRLNTGQHAAGLTDKTVGPCAEIRTLSADEMEKEERLTEKESILLL